MRGGTPTAAHETMRPSGFQPRSFAIRGVSENDGGGAVHDAAGVSGGDDAVFAKGGRQRLQDFGGGVGTAVIVFRDRDGFLSLLHFHGNNFIFHAAGAESGFGGLLAAERVFVASLASDSLLRGEIFRGLRHAEAAIAVEQAGDERILELAFAEFEAAARSANHVRRLRHIFHAAREDEFRFAEKNSLRGLADRLDARTAQAIDRDGGRFFGQAGFQSHVARTVERVRAGLHDVAENHVVEIGRIGSGAANRFASGGSAEIDCGGGVERAHVAGHWRASPGKNDDVGYEHDLPFHLPQGVARATSVSPPRWRASSRPASARLIHSVTRSSVSSP